MFFYLFAIGALDKGASVTIGAPLFVGRIHYTPNCTGPAQSIDKKNSRK
jgi:hypothetical protein